jgi:hypothetical protein
VGALGLVGALLVAACGDDAGEQADPVGPRSALSCIEDEGLRASLKPVADRTQSDPTVYLNVAASRTTTISVAFFTDPAGAKAFVAAQRQAARVHLNPNDTELVNPSTAVTVDRPGGVETERRLVTKCL